jgi:hypothetical protein
MSKDNLLNHFNCIPASDLAPFFLGLFEGAGGIYFTKTKNKFRAYFLIMLDDHPENKHLFECLNTYFQLKASVHRRKAGKKSKAKVVMQGYSVHTMCTLFDIVNQYRLLTSKQIVMFETLMKTCGYGSHKAENSARKKAYLLDGPVNIDKQHQHQIIAQNNQEFSAYRFEPWLSGYMESRARFAHYGSDIRISITIKNDSYLINTFKQHFQSHGPIVDVSRENQENFYKLNLGRQAFYRVMLHFQKYPFLGFQNKVYDQFCKSLALFPERKKNRVPILKSSTLSVHQNYIEPFFVGLLEGDGSISLARTKGGNLSYGVCRIGLKYNPENHTMLSLIKNCVGGSIHYRKKKKGNDEIIWTAVSQSHVKRILAIFEKYPLLTSGKICQLRFLKQCMANRDWDFHFKNRDLKYSQQEKWIVHYKHHFEIPHYFGPWLSGFFEAEGCFRKSAQSVYIGQNHDWYLLNAIKTYFQSHHKVGLHKDARRTKPHYRLSMSGKPTLEKIIKHFISNPLLGYKKVGFDLFCNEFKQKNIMCHDVSSL